MREDKVLFLYCIPDEPSYTVWEDKPVVGFNVASVIPIPELEGCLVSRYMELLPVNNPLDDLAIIRGLLHPKYGDRELADSLILQILLNELKQLGRKDIVEAVQSLR